MWIRIWHAAALLPADGIRNKIEPPPIFQVIYAAKNLPQVAHFASINAMERSASPRAFGDDVIEHYLHFNTEQAAYDKAVTTWERARYFEQI
jgi:glutamine synthetase